MVNGNIQNGPTMSVFPLNDNKMHDLPTSFPAPSGVILKTSPVGVSISCVSLFLLDIGIDYFFHRCARKLTFPFPIIFSTFLKCNPYKFEFFKEVSLGSY